MKSLAMKTIGAYEAKTHLPRLLEQVLEGERFVITKHGRPVAELIPVAALDPRRIKAAIAALRETRERLARRGVRLADVLAPAENVREALHEGHRY